MNPITEKVLCDVLKSSDNESHIRIKAQTDGKMSLNEARNMDWETFWKKLCEYELLANVSEIEAKDRVRAVERAVALPRLIASIYKISWQQAIEKLLTENRTSPWRAI